MTFTPRCLIALHPHFSLPGGAGTYLLEVGIRLAACGIRVIIVTAKVDERIVGPYRNSLEFIELGGPPSSQIGFWLRFPWHLWKIAAILRAHQDATIFPQVFPANWWAFCLRPFFPSRRMVWMCQEPSAFIHSRTWLNAVPAGLLKTLATVLNPVLRIVDRMLARTPNLVVVNSEFGKSLALKTYDYQPEKVHVTHLGADLSRFSTSPHTRTQSLVTVGRLTRFKNIDRIIRAIKLLREQHALPCELQIVGKGEAEEELRALVATLNLSASVHFHGTLDNDSLVALLQQSRAFVLASEEEPFGLVAVEAMACGTPAIVSARGGPSETVIHGVSGFHLPQVSPEEIAAAASQLLSNDALFQSLSNGARLRAQEFSWDNVADRTEPLLFERVA